MKVLTPFGSRFEAAGANRVLTRRDVLKAGGGLAIATLAAGRLPLLAGAQGATTPAYTAHTDVKGEVTFWHFWGSPLRRTAVRRIVAQFKQVYPDIQVKETYVP